MNYILLLIGFVLLIKGADWFVDGASSLAQKLKVPSILIGLTIVAFGTSSPEAAVSINAALKDSSQLAVSNIVGSNIFNILLVVGIASIIKPISIKTKTILKEFPFMILATIVLYILGNDLGFQNATVNSLSLGDGLILLSVFAVFLYYLVEMAVLSKDTDIIDLPDESEKKPVFKSVIVGLIGLVGILLGSELVVRSSTSIALALGMSQTLVGLTIVSIGTSLPELVTSLVAASKGESDIAIGNAIGSNLFNIFTLGITSVISPIIIEGKIITDIIVLLGVTVLAFIFATTSKKTSKIEGALLTSMYMIYMFFVIARN